jgi:hypothetical protein
MVARMSVIMLSVFIITGLMLIVLMISGKNVMSGVMGRVVCLLSL